MKLFKQFQFWVQKTLTHWLHIDLTKKSQRNSYYLVLEVFFATFSSAAAAFNAAYAIRLGAGDEQISLLTSIPALFAVLISIPAGRLLEKTSDKKSLLVRSLTLHRIGYLLVILAPYLSILNLNRGTVVVWLFILFLIPANFFNIGFTALTAKAVDPSQRGAVFSLRNQIFFAVRAICSFLFGLWLDAIIFPLNYQIMYGATFLISMASLFYLSKIEVKNDHHEKKVLPKKEPIKLKQRLGRMIDDFRKNPQFTRYNINSFIMDFGLWSIAPLFMIFYVNELNAQESWLGLNAAISSIANIFGFGLWRRIINRHGRKKALLFTSLLRPVFPFVVALIPNLTAIIIANIVLGLLMPGLSMSLYSLMMDAIPNSRRDEFTAYYTMFTNASMFIGPLVGAAVASQIGYRTTFLIFGGIRLLGGLMWRILPVKELKPDMS